MSDHQLDPERAADESAEDDEDEGEAEPLMELVYGAIGRISALAAGREIAEHK